MLAAHREMDLNDLNESTTLDKLEEKKRSTRCIRSKRIIKLRLRSRIDISSVIDTHVRCFEAKRILELAYILIVSNSSVTVY